MGLAIHDNQTLALAAVAAFVAGWVAYHLHKGDLKTTIDGDMDWVTAHNPMYTHPAAAAAAAAADPALPVTPSVPGVSAMDGGGDAYGMASGGLGMSDAGF